MYTIFVTVNIMLGTVLAIPFGSMTWGTNLSQHVQLLNHKEVGVLERGSPCVPGPGSKPGT